MSIVAQEPLFYGLKAEPGVRALSAEDFVARVEALQLQNEWNDQKTAAEAIGWLRGEGRRWFHSDILAVYSQATVDAAKRSFLTFKKLFQEQFFTVRSIHDLSADWSLIKQRRNERARDFCQRIAGELHEFVTIADNDAPVVPTAVEELFMSDLREDMTNAEKEARQSAGRRLLSEWGRQQERAGRWLVGRIIAKKLMAQGVSDTRLSKLIRKHDCRGEDILTIVRAVDEAERRATADAEKVAETDDDSEDEDKVTAIPANKKKKKKATKSTKPTSGDKPTSHGGSNGKNGENQNGYNRGNGFNNRQGGNRPTQPRPCGFCGEMGHWMSQCPLKAQVIRMAMKQQTAAAPVITGGINVSSVQPQTPASTYWFRKQAGNA